jgi:class 3 adenylate cyclase/tetratricopeptide (TPR) repeat protein
MAPRSFRFASFTLDLDRRSLHTPSGEVKLRPKNLAVLRSLIENAQRAVTKETMISTVWPGVTVGDEVLTRCICDVRRVLGDQSWILKTVPKHGYMLDVPVEHEEAPATEVAREGQNNGGTPTLQTPADAPVLSPPAIRQVAPQLRHLTILVCNLAGLKTLAATLGPEDLHKVNASYDRCIAEVIERHGGFIVQHQPEGIQACFGYPHAHDDDAERAVLAGLAATRAVGELRVGAGAQRLQARVGIATGLVVVGDLAGTGRSFGTALTGKAPLLAAELASLADPGAVVISGSTRRIVGGLFACRSVGGADPKELAEAAEASVVLHEDAVAGRFEALRGPDPSPLVGREEELGFLLRCWEDAKSGSGRVVLLTGDGGIGKSRIALALRERLVGQDYTELVYHCSPHHQDTALYPITTHFNRAAGIRRNDSAEVRLAKLKAALALSGKWSPEHVALFAALLSIPPVERYRLPDMEPQQLKERTFGAMQEMLRRLCAERPVLAVFEDLHWIDHTSLERLSDAVEEAPNLPLLVVGTARDEFVPPWPDLWHTSRRPLARLSPPDVEALIGSVTQGKALPPEVVAQIIARTDGVPLYVEEVTKSVLESGRLREVGGNRYELTGAMPLDIPATLHASLAARLDRLPGGSAIAQIAAAIGPEFSYGLIAAVADLPEPDLKAGLAQLVAAELIFQRGAPPDAGYRFKHTLVRDAAHESMMTDRRQSLHGRIARAIEEQLPSIATTTPGTLAHHYAEAGNLDTAVSYWMRAGRLSLRRSAMVEARNQLERSLNLLADLPETVERKKQEVEARLMMFQACLTLGEIERMTETLKTAVQIAEALGDERKLAFATGQLALAQWMSGEHVAAAQSARFALDYAERTEKLAHAGRDDTLTLQVFGKYTLANALHGQGRLMEAIALHREIIDLLASPGLEGQRFAWAGLPSVMSRAFLGWFLIEVGQFDAAWEHIERGCQVADAAQQPYAQVLIHAGEGLYHLRRGDPEKAVPVLKRTLKMCQRVPTMEAIVAGWLGSALVQGGRPAEALSVTEDAFRRGAHRAGGKYTWFYLFKAIGEAKAARGCADEALAWVDRAIQVTEEAQECLHRAQGLKCRGDMRLTLSLATEAAIQDLESARRIAEEHGLAPLAAECDLSLARAHQRAGRDREAHQLAARAAQAFRALGLERHLAEAERLGGG